MCLLSIFADMLSERHIIQELQKENTAMAGRNKVLESENRILLTETESLREVCRTC